MSVVVPVYNVAHYLRRCLDSLTSQSYADLDIIVVDDGSTDASGEICDDFARRDPRIRVLHQTNAGVAAARNAGLAAALGARILFVDSDDWVSPDLVNHLRAVMDHTGADIAVGEFIRTRTENAWPRRAAVSDSAAMSGPESLRHLMGPHHTLWTVPWGKLFRRPAIGELRFPEGRFHEDEFFTYRVLAGAKRVAHTSAAHYFYRIRPGSIMDSDIDPRRARDALDAYRERADFIDSHGPQDLIGAAREQEFRRYLPLYRSSFAADRRAVRREMRSAARILHSLPTRTTFRVFATAYALAPSIVDPLYRTQLSLKRLALRRVDASSA